MQATDEAKHLHSKGDEDAINFRPSSNFKYMKKYCKGTMDSSCNRSGSESGSGGGGVSGEEDARVQPPLPPGPPPPDWPPALVTPKLEVDEPEPADAPYEQHAYRIMCRQYARGACTHGAACIYAHEIVLSQLPGLYTFCRNFQNAACTFPRCKYVHASVFEKEYFYRTGYLPPHAIAHLKQGAVQGPAQSLLEGGTAEAPPPFPLSAAAALTHTAPSSSAAEARRSDEAGDIDLGASDAREPTRTEGLAPPPRKKCSNCDVIEFKRQCQRHKKEKLTRSIQELERNTALLSKKCSKQLTLLLALLSHSGGAGAEAGAGAGAGAGSRVETADGGGAVPGLLTSTGRNSKEKAIMEKLNVIFAANPAALHNNPHQGLSAVLVQLLLGGAEEAPLPPLDVPP